jgi:hypothetical protein
MVHIMCSHCYFSARTIKEVKEHEKTCEERIKNVKEGWATK